MTKTPTKPPRYTGLCYRYDSYGTHSSSMPKLSEVLREEFVNMYEQHDVLTDLRQHAISVLGTEDIPHPPSKGNLIYVRCWNHHILCVDFCYNLALTHEAIRRYDICRN